MRTFVMILMLCLCLVGTKDLAAHCEIPCGIYDDPLRVTEIREHITTIEKSIREIQRLEKESPKNTNQLVRWVINKEDHAQKINEIVQQYFLHQRIKPVDEENEDAYQKYTDQLIVLHKILIATMKARQNTDTKYTTELRDLTDQFSVLYFGVHVEEPKGSMKKPESGK